MSFNIISAEIVPNPINTKGYFTLKIKIEECNYDRLTKHMHSQLNLYTHKQLRQDKLDD